MLLRMVPDMINRALNWQNVQFVDVDNPAINRVRIRETS